jgi:hypothetical protein
VNVRKTALVTALAATTALAELSYELLRSRWTTDYELWATRIGLASGILLLANLVVIWWYAQLTHDLVLTGRDQLNLGQRQHALSERQLNLAREHFVVQYRPVVVIDCQKEGDAWLYVVNNIGVGPAVDVVYKQESGPGRPRHLPALGPLARQLAPPDVQAALARAQAGSRHLISAKSFVESGAIVTVSEKRADRSFAHSVSLGANVESWADSGEDGE